VTASTATYNVSTGTWMVTVPASYTGNVFLSGVAYQATAAIAAGLSNVTWTGSFSADTAGVQATWAWGAAVYTSFSPTLTALGVKPVDNSTASAYADAYPAGTPENFLSYVTSGGTGPGGKAYTGTYGTSVQFILPDYLL
jgi:hypothetical protein